MEPRPGPLQKKNKSKEYGHLVKKIIEKIYELIQENITVRIKTNR